MRRRGDAWGLRVILGVDPASGKKRSVTRSVRGGKRDAERTLAQTFEIDRFYVRLQASGDRVGHRRSEAHTTAKCTSSDLLRLEHLRTLIASRDPAAATARLLLFSASGFERNLVNHVRHRSDVELINLARLYTGQ